MRINILNIVLLCFKSNDPNHSTVSNSIALIIFDYRGCTAYENKVLCTTLGNSDKEFLDLSTEHQSRSCDDGTRSSVRFSKGGARKVQRSSVLGG
jgi:hypothetical protein